MIGGQKGQGMNWKAGDRDGRLDIGGHFRVLARELESEGLESKLCWVWVGCVLGSYVCLSLGCAVCRVDAVGCTQPWTGCAHVGCLAWRWAVRESEVLVCWGWAVSHHREGVDVTTAPSSHADSITPHT